MNTELNLLNILIEERETIHIITVYRKLRPTKYCHVFKYWGLPFINFINHIKTNFSSSYEYRIKFL